MQSNDPSTTEHPRWELGVLAHNEADRIDLCINSLPLEAFRDNLVVHVMANGCTDETAQIVSDLAVRHANLHLHEIKIGDKCNAWNCFVHEIADPGADVFFIMDGDVEIKDGSFPALSQAIRDNTHVNLASAPPCSGRKAKAYRGQMLRSGGVFGGLYAMSADFVGRMRDKNIRLPLHRFGDDGFAGALACIDLRNHAHWDKSRIMAVADAGFFTEVRSLFSWKDLSGEYQRLVKYSIRHFQTQITRDILIRQDAEHLPADMYDAYPLYPHLLRLKWRGGFTIFDWIALRRIKRLMAQLEKPES